MRRILWMLCLSGAAWAGDKTGAEDVKKQAGKTVEAAGDYVGEKKEEFEKSASARLERLNKDLALLKKDAAKRKDQAEAEASHLLKEAEGKGAVAEKKLGDLKHSTGDAWKDLRKGVSKAVDDFADGVETAKKR
jgi:hypothetical protein